MLHQRESARTAAVTAVLRFGVVLGAIAMLATGWLWLDPAISMVIAVVIVYGTWGLWRASLNLVMDAVPEHIDEKRPQPMF